MLDFRKASEGYEFSCVQDLKLTETGNMPIFKYTSESFLGLDLAMPIVKRKQWFSWRLSCFVRMACYFRHIDSFFEV